MSGYSSLELCSGQQAGGRNTAQVISLSPDTHTIHSLSHTLKDSSEVNVHLFCAFMVETTHLGIEPATFRVIPVITASSRVHTEPDLNQL